MNLDRFEEAARGAFAFLEDEFGFTFIPDSDEDRKRFWWDRQLTYRNDTTFVRVDLDDRDRTFNVLFGPLDEGEIPEYPIFLPPPGAPLAWFPLWAVLESRDEKAPPFSFAKGDRLEAELRGWAAALRNHAGPALRGSFAGLESVEQVLRTRLEEAERELDDRIGRSRER